MPNPEFSEFQFAYSVTRELESRQTGISLLGLPWFPTQNLEGDIGFDVAFPNGVSPLCLQYKRSKRLDDARARNEEWNVYRDTYYRFDIRTANRTGKDTSNKQHEILVNLANDFPDTYYVAPEFITLSNYSQFAQNDRVTVNAAFAECQGAPKPNDNDDHVICHRPQDDKALLFSDAPNEQELSVRRGTESILEMTNQRGPQFEDEEGLRRTFRNIRSRIVEQGEFDIDPDEYESELFAEWIGLQQRFFRESVAISLHLI